jgi:hypothetical protein
VILEFHITPELLDLLLQAVQADQDVGQCLHPPLQQLKPVLYRWRSRLGVGGLNHWRRSEHRYKQRQQKEGRYARKSSHTLLTPDQ